MKRTIPRHTPECPYCGETKNLRIVCPAIGKCGPVYTCEDCFTGRDDGPCFDDLPEVPDVSDK